MYGGSREDNNQDFLPAHSPIALNVIPNTLILMCVC